MGRLEQRLAVIQNVHVFGLTTTCPSVNRELRRLAAVVGAGRVVTCNSSRPDRPTCTPDRGGRVNRNHQKTGPSGAVADTFIVGRASRERSGSAVCSGKRRLCVPEPSSKCRFRMAALTARRPASESVRKGGWMRCWRTKGTGFFSGASSTARAETDSFTGSRGATGEWCERVHSGERKRWGRPVGGLKRRRVMGFRDAGGTSCRPAGERSALEGRVNSTRANERDRAFWGASSAARRRVLWCLSLLPFSIE